MSTGRTILLVLATSGCSSSAPPMLDLDASTEAMPTRAAIGDGCTADTDCLDGLSCLTEGQPGGLCTQPSCKTDTCPEGTACMILDSSGTRACLKTCEESAACRGGWACADTAVCTPKCAEGACALGTACDADTGLCVPDLSKVPAAPYPTPSCDDLPPRDCTGSFAECSMIEPFVPEKGRGYDNYPLNGETAQDQYRSFARHDLIMLVKWTAAYVDCKASSWKFGNHQPLGLGDMSEANGAIPGTREGQPGHPQGTHTNGFDEDNGYYQLKAQNNQLRPICPHTSGGSEASHCTAPPTDLDAWRTTLAIGAAFTSNRVRVLGVDGQVGPILEQKAPTLCKLGFLPSESCTRFNQLLAFEVTNMNYGWYYFHHHHWHISLKPLTQTPPAPGAPTLDPNGAQADPIELFQHLPGHVGG